MVLRSEGFETVDEAIFGQPGDLQLLGSRPMEGFGAVVEAWRKTQDVDIAALHGAELAEELRKFLNKRFHIAVRVREIRGGIGYRIYQVQKKENRHLIDVRPVEKLPPAQRVKKVLVVTPPELIANKVMSLAKRGRKPKGLIDKADLYRLLLTFPDLKTVEGPVADRLRAAGATAEVFAAWKALVAEEILPEDEDDKFLR